MANLYTHQDANVRKTWLLMTTLFVVLVGLGWVVARAENSPIILYIAVALALVGNVVSYWY